MMEGRAVEERSFGAERGTAAMALLSDMVDLIVGDSLYLGDIWCN